jgi:predicted MFS family arabinose efflux permease
VIGAVCLGVLVYGENRKKSPMLPLGLFRSRTFSLANILTLLLYGALGVVMFLVPLVLIQVERYSPTQAGAALVPFAVIMFALSRWSGGLIKRVGPRLPLTVGPALAAVGIALFALMRPGSSYWSGVFPAVCLLGLGMAITVAPLTTAVMGAVETSHSGVASGVNNSVSRVAGLLTIALFGILLARTFDARVHSQLERLQLSPGTTAQIDEQLPKMAGAELGAVQLGSAQRVAVERAIDDAFVAGFRIVTLASALLALSAAGFGAAIRQRHVRV